MSTPTDVAQYKALLDKAQALVAEYQKVLEIRTKERDSLSMQADTTNVVQLTPTILQRERRDAANSIIKIAMRRLRQMVGYNARIHQTLSELLDADERSVDSERKLPPKDRA
jgi:predicted component of viral defense system (DUF524 family)